MTTYLVTWEVHQLNVAYVCWTVYSGVTLLLLIACMFTRRPALHLNVWLLFGLWTFPFFYAGTVNEATRTMAGIQIGVTLCVFAACTWTLLQAEDDLQRRVAAACKDALEIPVRPVPSEDHEPRPQLRWDPAAEPRLPSATHLRCALNIHKLTHFSNWNGLAEEVNAHVAAAFEYSAVSSTWIHLRLSRVLDKHTAALAFNGPSMSYVDAYRTALLEILKYANQATRR
jgi:hypothetical protein